MVAYFYIIIRRFRADTMNVDDILRRAVVIYCTRYGSTAEVALALADGLGIPAKKTTDFKTNADLEPYDLVFLGAPIYYDDVLDEMKKFVHAFYPVLDEKHKILFTVFGAIKGHLQRNYADNFARSFTNAPMITINFLERATKDTMSVDDYEFLEFFYTNRLNMPLQDFDYFGSNNFEDAVAKIRQVIVEKY